MHPSHKLNKWQFYKALWCYIQNGRVIVTKIKQKLFINTLVRGRFFAIGLNFVKQCYFAIQMTFI